MLIFANRFPYRCVLTHSAGLPDYYLKNASDLYIALEDYVLKVSNEIRVYDPLFSDICWR